MIVCRRSSRQCLARLIRLRSTLHPPPGSGFLPLRFRARRIACRQCEKTYMAHPHLNLHCHSYIFERLLAKSEGQFQKKFQRVKTPSVRKLSIESNRFWLGCKSHRVVECSGLYCCHLLNMELRGHIPAVPDFHTGHTCRHLCAKPLFSLRIVLLLDLARRVPSQAAWRRNFFSVKCLSI